MLLALALIVVAGVLGGSVLVPIKRMRAWSFQNSRAVYSLWTFFLMPWVVGFATVPHLLSVYPRAPAQYMLICGASGFGWSHRRCNRRAARLRCAATPGSLPTRDRGARVGGGCGRTRRCWPKGGGGAFPAYEDPIGRRQRLHWPHFSIVKIVRERQNQRVVITRSRVYTGRRRG